MPLSGFRSSRSLTNPNITALLHLPLNLGRRNSEIMRIQAMLPRLFVRSCPSVRPLLVPRVRRRNLLDETQSRPQHGQIWTYPNYDCTVYIRVCLEIRRTCGFGSRIPVMKAGQLCSNQGVLQRCGFDRKSRVRKEACETV